MIEFIKNPRGPDGSLGNISCDICNGVSGAYIRVFSKAVCKSCLLKWVEVIDKEILSCVGNRFG